VTIVKRGHLLLSIFGAPHKNKKKRKRKKNKKHCWKKTKKYIAVRRRHSGAQKMVKDWMRKFKNTKIEI
jgi:hypothetical protein